MIYLMIGCKCFPVVTTHATFTGLLKQPIDKLTYHRQAVHCIEPRMPFAQYTSIKALDKADLVSRHPEYPSGRCPPAHAR